MSQSKTPISRYVGGILLVAGTTIGAGMLALPVATAFLGFFPSLFVFAITWLIMLCSAFFFLDINLSIEGNCNLITMVEKTLGGWAKAVAWVFYLLLLYSLIAAYIAASAPIFNQFISNWVSSEIPDWVGPFVLPLCFGWFIYLGTLGVDWLNKFLMVGLALSYLLLVGKAPSHIEINLLYHYDFSISFVAFAIIVTSFGYHVIIPSLKGYMKGNAKDLKKTLIIGSLIPLFVYIIWQFIVLGTVPIYGSDGLAEAWLKGKSASEPLSKIVQSTFLKLGLKLFSFFAILTSFIGVSLSLSDFLTDGLKLKKSWEGRLIACFLTFLPPMIFVFTSSRGFILALEYAGIFVTVLLILFPALMALKKPLNSSFSKSKLRVLAFVVILFASFIIVVNFFQKIGSFSSFTKKYTTNLRVKAK